jgi:hypothetical protein
VRHDGAGEFRRREHGTLDVEMPVNQRGSKVCPAEVDCFLCPVIAEADYAPVVHGHVGLMNFTAQDIHDAGVFEKEFRRLFTAGDGEFLLELAHDWLPGLYASRVKLKTKLTCVNALAVGAETLTLTATSP